MPGSEALILGIESSCDETAAAVVSGGRRVVSNVIASQHDLHAEYRGVVPEIASRAHAERILPIVRSALSRADAQMSDLSAVAVGHRPGLIGSLLVGVAAAKALAWSLRVPLVGIDHVHAHLYAGCLEADPPAWPALGLVVSGGHTALYRCDDPLKLTRLGRTIDDAAGEAYDKVATILGLEYPGGPKLDRLARSGDAGKHDFPISRLSRDSLDFSFSGLKTAVLYTVQGPPRGSPRGKSNSPPSEGVDLSDERAGADVAASFQRAVCDALLLKLGRAMERNTDCRTLLVGGGVSANSLLRSRLTELAQRRGLNLRLPRMEFCMDNAAMIAGLAWHRLESTGWRGDPLSLAASPTSAC